MAADRVKVRPGVSFRVSAIVVFCPPLTLCVQYLWSFYSSSFATHSVLVVTAKAPLLLIFNPLSFNQPQCRSAFTPACSGLNTKAPSLISHHDHLLCTLTVAKTSVCRSHYVGNFICVAHFVYVDNSQCLTQNIKSNIYIKGVIIEVRKWRNLKWNECKFVMGCKPLVEHVNREPSATGRWR